MKNPKFKSISLFFSGCMLLLLSGCGGARINVPDLDLWAIVKIGPGTIQ